MSFAHLKRRVERGEALLDGRMQQASETQARLKREWREAWTPLRIMVAGFGAGLVTGRMHPEKAIGRIGRIAGPGTIQLLTSAIGLVGSLQAAIAAMTASGAAETAADTADDAAQEASRSANPGTGANVARAASRRDAGRPDPAPAPRSAERPRRHDQRWDSQPSPAEAATEISER